MLCVTAKQHVPPNPVAAVVAAAAVVVAANLD